MNSRLQALIDRGYSKEDVLRLANYTEEELFYASEKAFEHLSANCNKVTNPTIIYIGGQPGSGKTVLSMGLKNSLNNYIELGIDNYRMYHPRYLEIEKCIRNKWVGKDETVNDSPGNDIADFTHYFAGAMIDRLTELSSKLDEKGQSYNILMEWGMREPIGPLNTMNSLKAKGYNNIVLFLGVNKEVSYNACKLRADIMKNNRHIFRKVPKSFHDICVDTLPQSVEKIYKDGCDKGIIDHMSIISRDGEVLWDVNSKENPGKVYYSCLHEFKGKEYNDLFHAVAGNNKELIGLSNDKEKLKQIKESIVILNPSIEFDKMNNVKK